jgi:zinc/manganese transport system substrate-binding protein/manganese/iron transport system substrate-binding protein
MMRLIRVLMATIVLWLTLGSTCTGAVAAQDDRLQVAVSTPLLADIVRNVAGDVIDVYSVMPENADPHTWEAAPEDMVKVSESDSFISIGAHLEPFVESGGWRRAVLDAGVPQLVLAEHVDLIEVDLVIDHGDHVHDLRAGDPHIWLDPNKVIEGLPAIAAHLSEIDPGNAGTYQANAATYTVTLQDLDAELIASFQGIPEERRTLVVFHDAYTYFAAHYGFEVIGVVLKNPESEVSAQELAELQTIIEDNDVPVIFAEPQFNTEVLDVLVAETGIEVGELLTDAFAGRVSSYVELMRFNRDSLVSYLGE